MTTPQYYGEGECQQWLCKNKRYYESGGRYVCGVHSRNNRHRLQLPINPKKEEIRASYMKVLEQQARAAARPGYKGRLIMQRLAMMKGTPVEPEFFTVLPNFRAASGGHPGLIWAMPELSPMRLGPVAHQQPNLPDAKNLENFHQFNKVFQSEYDASTDSVLPVWYERRLAGYTDAIPHRHKLGANKQEHIKNAGGERVKKNANICLFSIFVGENGTEKRYSYLESRVFYCRFYEQLVSQTPQFKRLVEALYVRGQNLLIAGYDARFVNPDDAIDVDAWYADEGHPFGHEQVLFTMLWHYPHSDRYPWNK